MTICIRCLIERPETDFYPRKARPGQRETRCKFCLGKQTSDYRKANREKRNAQYRAYMQTEAGKKSKKLAKQRYRARHREKLNAQSMAQKAIAAGKLVPWGCMVCEETKVQAHHPDYSRPLDVVWLCQKHHSQLHYEARAYKGAENADS